MTSNICGFVPRLFLLFVLNEGFHGRALIMFVQEVSSSAIDQTVESFKPPAWCAEFDTVLALLKCGPGDPMKCLWADDSKYLAFWMESAVFAALVRTNAATHN